MLSDREHTPCASQLVHAGLHGVRQQLQAQVPQFAINMSVAEFGERRCVHAD